MPTALMTGSFERADPGRETVLKALRTALPGWDAVGSGELERRGDRLRATLAGVRSPLRFDATVLTGGMFEPGPGAGSPPPVGPFDSAATTASLALGRPAALLGVSAAPIRSRTRRALARALARRCGLLVLRDAASARALAQAGVPEPFRIGADPAWAAIGRPASGPAGDRVVVALCPAATGLARHLAEGLMPLARSGLEIDLLPWRPRGARGRAPDLAETVAAELRGVARILAPPSDLGDVARAVAGARLVLGFRHHALVAAAAAGTPFVALGHEPGLESLARELGQPAVAASAPAAELTAALAAGLGRPAPAAAAVSARIESASESLRLLRLLLSGGSEGDPHEIEGLPLEPAPGR